MSFVSRITTDGWLMFMAGTIAGLLVGWLIASWQARRQTQQWLAVQQNAEQAREQLKAEFEQLASRVLQEKGSVLSEQSQSSLNALLQPFRQQIDQFQQRVNQIHD